MKITIYSIISLIILGLTASAVTPSSRLKDVTFTVRDSTGEPVEGVFLEASLLGPDNAEGHTDATGKAVLQLNEGASLSLYASKDGYYRTGGRLWNGGIHKGPDGQLVARVIPDSFEIEIKKIQDPVHMRNHRIRERIPQSDEAIGYDLEVGDWVKPYGRGTVTDMFIQVVSADDQQSTETASLIIRFPNNGDGIQTFIAARPFSMEFGSDLAPPHRAPVSGYEPELVLEQNPLKRRSYYTEDHQNYLLRTRTLLDAEGRILRACYGYIQGEIHFDPRDMVGPQLELNYFFNPDPDPERRSLEYNLHVPKEYQKP